MTNVFWSPDARTQRREIYNFIEQEDPSAAAGMDTRFSQAAERLGNFPLLGRPGKLAGTREFIPHPNYRLVYEVAEDAKVHILTLVHVARQWPPVDPD